MQPWSILCGHTTDDCIIVAILPLSWLSWEPEANGLVSMVTTFCSIPTYSLVPKVQF